MSSRDEPPKWQIPPSARIPALELVLGAPVRDLTYAAIEQLCQRHVRETTHLDFKSTMYGHEKDEFAKDVVALANSSGGLILIGVKEQAEAAHEMTPVDISPDVDRSMQTVLSARVRPYLTDVAIAPVPDPDNPAQGCVLVFVPPETGQPYSVRSEHNKRLSFTTPVRDNTHTRYMDEAEIAARYRDRFHSDQQQRERLAAAEDEGVGRLVREGNLWLTVTVTPRSRGHWIPNRDAAGNWISEQAQHLPALGYFDSSSSVTRGRSRIICSEQYNFRGTSTRAHLELHADGTGFAGLHLGAVDETLSGVLGLETCPVPPRMMFSSEKLCLDLTYLCALLFAHASAAGASADVLLRSQLLPTPELDTAALEVRRNPEGEPVTIGVLEYSSPASTQFQRIIPGTYSLTRPSPLEVTTTTTLATDRSQLLQLVGDMATEIIGEFGQLPTTPLLADGQVNPDFGDQTPAHYLRSWAGAR